MMELDNISFEEALRYAEKTFADKGKDLHALMPDFEKNFRMAQSKATYGHKTRKEMPVVMQSDIKSLQKVLQSGEIQIGKPFDLLKKPIHFSLEKIEASRLVPTQKQIYFDKVIKAQANETRQQTLAFITSAIFVVSSDNKIIDGHHRFLSAILIDPTIKVKVLKVDLPMSELLPLVLKFSDQRNKRRGY